MHYRYVIVGGGTAAAAAIEGIRAHDREGGILMVTRENHHPYRRAPLSKEVWRGGYDLEQLSIHESGFYDLNGVEVRRRCEVVEIDAEHRVLWDETGDSIGFDHALIATGCRPRRLQAAGADSSGVRYYRELEDYLDLARRVGDLQHLTVVGGHFAGLELAASMRGIGKEVALIFPDEWPLHRMLPRALGEAVTDYLRGLGVETVSGDLLAEIRETGEYLVARTQAGGDLATQLVLVDLGGEPQVELAEAAGLEVDDGIVVDEYGRSSRPHLWAAGDAAEFPYLALGALMRIEGEDHAREHGRAVGANMAGADAPYAHMPRKWFRLGDLAFEGTGELNSRLDHQIVWIEEGREGVVYYLWEDVVRGVLFVNQPGRLDWARELVREARPMTSADRAALLTPQR